MILQKSYGVEGARQANGLVVIIDILRAATVEAFALSNAASYIIPVLTKREAFFLKKQNPTFILIGEEEGYKIKGFDFGNSPSEILKASIKNKVLIHRTSSGTKGLVNAIHAKELIFGSFVTCSSIVRYIKKKKPSIVSLVSMSNEDSIFADYLQREIEGKHPSKEKVERDLYNNPASLWFLDPLRPEFPVEDLYLALDFDRFDFVCLVKNYNNQLRTIKIHQ